MAEPADVVIYHNPDCGTSRNVLGLIRKSGIEPRVVEYLRTPLNRSQLQDLVAFVGRPVRDLMRERGTPFSELALGSPSKTEDDLFDSIVAHPILLNRPIVTTEERAVLCRPSDVVLDLLPPIPEADIRREDGTPFLSDYPIDAGGELEVAMEGAGLAADDLAGPDRTYFRYARLDREVIGYGGFELLGADAVLLRSLAVMERFHLQGNGRNMVLLLLSRAFAHGARTAFAFAETTDAEAFFAKLRFVEVDRSAAPPALAARFASVPRGTKLVRRRIAL